MKTRNQILTEICSRLDWYEDITNEHPERFNQNMDQAYGCMLGMSYCLSERDQDSIAEIWFMWRSKMYAKFR